MRAYRLFLFLCSSCSSGHSDSNSVFVVVVTICCYCFHGSSEVKGRLIHVYDAGLRFCLVFFQFTFLCLACDLAHLLLAWVDHMKRVFATRNDMKKGPCACLDAGSPDGRIEFKPTPICSNLLPFVKVPHCSQINDSCCWVAKRNAGLL